MGGSSSKVTGLNPSNGVLKCPDGYNATQFQKICTLFDKLDSDSNMGVSSDEIEFIAAHHVDNCIQRMNSRIAAKQKELHVATTQITIEKENAVTEIQQTFTARLQEEIRLNDTAKKTLENKVNWYISLDKNGQATEFIQAVMKKEGKNMDFWSFFEYMKTRTEDIENIKE